MYIPTPDGSFVVCGYVPKDAETKQVGEKKSTLTTWSILAQKENENTGKEAKWTSCQAWHDVARVASTIKKGDVVLAVGKIESREYEGKTYKNLNCEFVSIMGKAAVVDAKSAEPDQIPEGFEELLDGDLPF